jgi:hypothetical protein
VLFTQSTGQRALKEGSFSGLPEVRFFSGLRLAAFDLLVAESSGDRPHPNEPLSAGAHSLADPLFDVL